MNRRKFLRETIALTTAIAVGGDIVKEIQQLAPQKFKAIVLIPDVVNGNKRIYTKTALEKCVEVFNAYPKRSMMGELGIPNTSVISLERVSHLVTDMKLRAEDFLVEVEILDTPNGKKLAKLLADDAVVFRTRGIGNGVVNDNGVLIINDNYKLITVDAVNRGEAASLRWEGT